MAKTIYASDLRPSQLIKYENIAYVVVAREHANIGRGGASVLLSLRQLANNSKKIVTVNTNCKFEIIECNAIDDEFSHDDGDNLV